MCTEPPQFKQASQTTCPDIKPEGEQLSPKEKNPPLPIKMELSDVKIEPKEEEEEGDTMEQLATKNKIFLYVWYSLNWLCNIQVTVQVLSLSVYFMLVTVLKQR